MSGPTITENPDIAYRNIASLWNTLSVMSAIAVGPKPPPTTLIENR